MDRHKMLSVGDLAVVRPDVDILLLWPRQYSFFAEETEEVDASQILLILDLEKRSAHSRHKARVSEEWKRGAYFVLSNEGKRGWVGEGWLMPLDTGEKDVG